ncbi:hypothetical protein ACB094_01G353700 [Castanea mollissima]
MKLFTLILFSASFLLGCNGDVSSLISSSLFESMLKHRNDQGCNGFYTYNAFIIAAQSLSAFGTTGDVTTRKRELAAFFGQISHETTGGWSTAPDGPYAWGYCFVREVNRQSGDQYYGQGLIQLTYNYNYDLAGKAIGVNLLNNLDLVATNTIISFKTAIWFWMTAQGNKPSSQDVIIGNWRPSSDTFAG